MAKNFINQDNIAAKKNRTQRPVISTATLPLNADENSILIDKKNGFTFHIPSKKLLSMSRNEILDTFKIATSPLFLQLPEEGKQKEMVSVDNVDSIGIFMEMSRHYTGGRYSIVHQAILLSEHFNVTIVADRKISFLNDFADYPGFKNLEVVVDGQFKTDKKFDLVIGVPNISAQYAHVYAEKNNVKFYCMMFESPNYVRKYREGRDSTEEYWENFKKVISKADAKISPSFTSMKYLKEWIGDNKNNYFVINPCINDVAIDKFTRTTKKFLKEFDLVMTSRITPFKTPYPVLNLLDKNLKSPIRVALIGKNVTQQKSPKYKNIEIVDFGSVDDTKKFEIILKSKVMIFPSKFEGYGMPPMEGLYFGVPVIAYKLNVLKEVYGDSILFAKSKQEFVDLVMKSLASKKSPSIKKDRVITSKMCKEQLLNVLPVKKWPKITAGMIVYDGIDYMKYAIDSVYDDVDEIIIVEGAVRKYADKPHSTDGTFEYLQNIERYDPKGKIRVVFKSDGFWDDKVQMQNEIAKRITGDIYIKVDADEIWEPGAIKNISDFMRDNKDIDIIRMPFVHLWTAFNIKAVDSNGKWSTKHPRIWRWKKSFRHAKSFNFFVDTVNDKVHVKAPRYKEYEWVSNNIFHFGYARALKTVNNKLKYYKNRGIENDVQVELYQNWKKLDDSTQPTQKSSGSKAVKINRKILPQVLKTHPYYNKKDIRKS